MPFDMEIRMPLSREKAKQPIKAIAAKAVKAIAKPVKVVAKKAIAEKKPLPPKIKGKVALQQTPPPKQMIEKAKAALKTEKTVVESAPAKPISKAKARKIMMEASANEAASALAAKWATLYRKAEQIDAKPYNMKGIFEEKTAITHKVLGWGYILANRNDRLEVLFKDGIKHLISNYKP
jgi:hypothetical protein